MDDQIRLLDLEGVDPPGDAAREIIDPDKVRELAESIRSQGLLQPILVRPKNGRYETVAGHRRVLAHRLLGEVKIKAIVKELTDDETFLVRAIENDQREDLNPIEKAKIYRKLKDKFGMSTHTIAQKMGRSHQTVMRYLKLLDVPDDFQSAVARGKMSMSVALCLAEIEDLEWRSYYFQAALDNGATEEVAQYWVNEYRKTRAGPGPHPGGDSGVSPQGQESLPIYGSCYICLGPCEVNQLKYIPVCPCCHQESKGALKSEKK